MERARELELGTSAPADLFDATLDPAREAELRAVGLEVVARPGAVDLDPVESGDICIRRGIADGRLAVVSTVEGPPGSRESLEARGVRCEGHGDGLFVEVYPGPRGGTAGRRIRGADGLVPWDTTVLRRRRPVTAERVGALPVREAGPAAPPQEDDPAAMLREAVYALRSRRGRTVREEYLGSLLEPSTGAPPLREELQRAVAELERRLPTLPAGPGRQAALDALAGRVLTAAERVFILDPRRSTLELLEPSERDRYLRFSWHENDFPGGPAGTNEARAERMFRALTRLRPERRANQGDHAVVRRDEFDDAMQRRVEGALVPVPDERGQRLHRDASAAYVQARTAAAAEGVTLAIGNSFRTAQRARASAARADNPRAVASFSSHALGLAVDLRMSHGGLRFTETTTRPFQNLVDMYRSPVHKWMFLRGEAHGWFPYRREPWHWEYNPTGFREIFRRPEGRPASARSEVEPLVEAAGDPVIPIVAPLSLAGSVGRGGRNRAADVRAVQGRLVALRVLAAAGAAAERPGGAGTTTEASLPRTIAAIESFQRHLGLRADGAVDDAATRLELDRAIPVPTAAEYAAVATRRGAIGQSVSRGLTLTGPVGATATGNAPGDVRAVQRRLVELGDLAASHGETPPAGTAAIAQARLRATIAAIRRFQRDVRFWLGRGTIRGRVANGVAVPGDATAALLDRVSAYEMTSGSDRIRFHDHVRSGHTRSEAGVMFVGTSSPRAIPTADYVALGITPGQAAALQFVSTHEGNFDAINTYDVARVSVGFIQFAGGRGLPPYLALLKSRKPAKFRSLLQDLGLDVEFTVARGEIRSARVVLLDPAGRRVLRATAAEEAIRDDKRLTTAFILSGRDRDVQLEQIEAAIRDYVFRALGSTVSWGSVRAPLRDLIRSERGMAMLFDRAIQEGVAGARIRFERVIRAVHTARPAPTVADLAAREADVITEIERDLRAGAEVATLIGQARAALRTLVDAAGAGGGSTTATVLARPEMTDARGKVTAARARLADVVNVTAARGSTIDATIASTGTALRGEEARLAFTPAPASVADLERELTSSRHTLSTAAGPLSRCEGFLRRIERIRGSSLRSA